MTERKKEMLGPNSNGHVGHISTPGLLASQSLVMYEDDYGGLRFDIR